MNEEQQKIVLENLRLVTLVIKKLNVNYDFNDLTSVGLIGLCKGAKSFDPSKGYKASTYLTRCIQNEIFYYFRSIRKPTNNTVSIDTPIADNLTLEDTIADDFDIEKNMIEKDQINIAKMAMQSLNEKEKIVVVHRYGIDGAKKLTQEQLAKKLNTSQATVSRLYSHAIKKIKKELESEVTNEYGIRKSFKEKRNRK